MSVYNIMFIDFYKIKSSQKCVQFFSKTDTYLIQYLFKILSKILSSVGSCSFEMLNHALTILTREEESNEGLNKIVHVNYRNDNKE